MKPRAGLVACALGAMLARDAAALPSGAQVAAGSVAFSQAGNVLNVANTPGAIVNWRGFSIGAGETVRFVQQSAQSAILNRVVGQDPSPILGNLQSNGRVFLVNPNGIVFGQGARIDVAGLVASSLNLTDGDFLAGRHRLAGSDANGMVVNQGHIATADGGLVYLIAPDVKNSGIVNAPNGEILLAAGHSVSIAPADAPDMRVRIAAPTGGGAVNVGELIARSGSIGIYGANITQGGMADASAAVRGADGRVYLKALDSLTAKNGSATTADGGDVTLTSGRLTTLEAGSAVRADGGRLKVWSDGDTLAKGSLRARNGFVETSGKYLDVGGIDVDARGGTWLIDPTDITIGGGSGNPCTLSGGACSVSGASSTIDAASLASLLGAGTNITVDTAGGGAGNGDITVSSAVSWNASSLLTLNANRHIQVDAAIGSTGGSLKLRADSAGTGTGTVSFGAGGGVALSGGGRADIYYNPANVGASGAYGKYAGSEKSDSSGNPYSGNVTGTYTAWMLVNSTNDIFTTGGFQNMNDNLDGYYAQGKNIDFTGVFYSNGFRPVGWDANYYPFTGKFNGQGHTIANLSITGCTGSVVSPCLNHNSHVGLFGATSSTAVIQNVGLTNVTVQTDTSAVAVSHVGTLVGSNDGQIANSYATGTIGDGSYTARGSEVGGLVGTNYGTISNSHAAVTIYGSSYVGGLVGYHSSGTIGNSYATGSVNAASWYSGGLAGYNSSSGTIGDSYATGGVASSSYAAGGLIGSNGGTVSRSHASGNVSGTYYVGGLAGLNRASSSSSYGQIADSYATGTASGTASSGSYYAVGGLAGKNEGAVASSYAIGQASSTSGTDVGGLVGLNTAYNGSPASIQNSFWNNQTSCAAPPCATGIGGGSTAGATGLSSSAMKTASNFSGAGWGIATSGGGGSAWRIYDGQTMPLLRALLTPLTITASNASKTYDGNAYASALASPTYSTSSVNTSLIPNWSDAYGSPVAAGSYAPALYSTQAGYDLSYVNGTLTVNPAVVVVAAPPPTPPLSAAITGNPTKTYDGTAAATLSSADFSLSGFVGGDSATVNKTTGTYDSAAVGTRMVTVSLASGDFTAGGGTVLSNYILPTAATGIGTIGRAPLTVTANAARKTYDGLAHGGGNGVTYTGFVNGETAAVLGGALVYGGSAQGAVNVGGYAIVPSGLTAGNYAISYASGTLIVNPASLTIAANAATKTYDGLAHGGGNGVTYTGFVNGETAAVLGGALVYGGSAQGAVNVGGYAIVPSGLTAGNYALRYVDAALAVNPASLTITANAADKFRDGLPYRGGNGVSYAGFVHGETAAVLDGALAYGGAAQGAVEVGAYALQPYGVSSRNYAITFRDGILTIGPSPLTTATSPLRSEAGQMVESANRVDAPTAKPAHKAAPVKTKEEAKHAPTAKPAC